jgi:hypothetical protein
MHHAMKTYGRREAELHQSKRGTRWGVSRQLQAPVALLAEKQPPVQEKLDRAQIRSKLYEDDKYIFPFQGIELRFLVCPTGRQSLYRPH